MGVMLSLVLVGGAGYGMIVLLHALQQKLTGGATSALHELEEIKQRLEQLEAADDEPQTEDMAFRLAEVEGRLEFAERLLSSVEHRAKLPESTDEVSAESARG